MSRAGYWLVLAAAVLWGTTGTAQTFAPAGASPQAVGAVRLLIGGTVLLLFAWNGGVLRRPTRAELPALVVGAAGVAAYQVCFFAGLSLTGVAVGTIIGIGSAPILSGLLDALVNQEPLTRRWTIATALALLGCALLTLPGEQVRVDALGVLLSIGAGASYAVYTLAGKRLLKTVAADAMVALVFGSAMLLLLPILFVSDLSWLIQPSGLLVALHLGLITLGLSYVLFGRGLKHIPASTAVTLSLAEPLTAGLLGVLVVGEGLTLTGAAGTALLFAGLLWLTAARGYERAAAVPAQEPVTRSQV
jgi:DME family drug/metabolite transporter